MGEMQEFGSCRNLLVESLTSDFTSADLNRVVREHNLKLMRKEVDSAAQETADFLAVLKDKSPTLIDKAIETRRAQLKKSGPSSRLNNEIVLLERACLIADITLQLSTKPYEELEGLIYDLTQKKTSVDSDVPSLELELELAEARRSELKRLFVKKDPDDIQESIGNRERKLQSLSSSQSKEDRNRAQALKVEIDVLKEAQGRERFKDKLYSRLPKEVRAAIRRRNAQILELQRSGKDPLRLLRLKEELKLLASRRQSFLRLESKKDPDDIQESIEARQKRLTTLGDSREDEQQRQAYEVEIEVLRSKFRIEKGILQTAVERNYEIEELRAIKRYFKKQDRDYLRQLDRLDGQIESSLKDKCRVIVCIPAFGEEKNIYRTLSQYLGQKNKEGRYLNPDLYELIVFDNFDIKHSADNTREEVARFKKDFPQLNVRYIQHQFQEEKPLMGKVRKYINDLAIARILKREEIAAPAILVSHDADMPEMGLSPTYMMDLIDTFDRNSKVDMVVGRRDFSEEILAKYPLLHLLVRFERFVQLQAEHKHRKGLPYTYGNNSAFRARAYANIGGYKKKWRIAEDLYLGRQMYIYGLGNQRPNNILQTNRLWVQTDARRYLDSLKRKGFIAGQYSHFQDNLGVRRLTDKGMQVSGDFLKMPTSEMMEKQINAYAWGFRKKYGISRGNKYMSRALNWLGIAHEIQDDNKIKVLNLDKALADLVDYKREVEAFKGISKGNRKDYRQVRSLAEERTGQKTIFAREIPSSGNTVYLVGLENGRNIYIKIPKRESSLLSLKKEAWCLKRLVKEGVRVPLMLYTGSDSRLDSEFVVVTEELIGRAIPESEFLRYSSAKRDNIHFKLGQELAAIHRAKVDGFGPLNENGKGSFSAWDKYLTSILGHRNIPKLLERGILEKEVIRDTQQLLRKQAKKIKLSEARLVHGDIWLDNFLIKDDKIIGIIDWENAVGGDPVYDLARYSVSQDKDFDMTEVFKGYGVVVDSEFLKRFYLYRIHCCLYSIARRSDPSTIRGYQGKMKKSIKALRKLI
jgi:aminoglycoside phosphotransferase (APT) family kinase protein